MSAVSSSCVGLEYLFCIPIRANTLPMMMSYTHKHVRMKDVRDRDMKRQCGHLTSTASSGEVSGAVTPAVECKGAMPG